MIPRIQTGSSFKGAGLYYLRDKRADGEEVRESKARVAWTHAINTLENDPDAVLAEMRHTAFDQFILKMESGNRIDGRPTEKSVMTVSLAWAPTEEVTREEMIAASRSYLEHMNWHELQVLLVAHNDTKHPHVHLIINRIHPETGITQDAAWTKQRSQQWALEYERERGYIYCEARERRYGGSARGPSSLTQREWKHWQELSKENVLDPEYRLALEKGEWDVLKQSQKDKRVAFWKDTTHQRKELRTALREQVRSEFAEDWNKYAIVRAERDQAELLYNREARRAMRELRRAGKSRKVVTEMVDGPDGRKYLKKRVIESAAIEQIKTRQKAYNARQREDLWKLRKAIMDREGARLELLAAPALDHLSKDRMKAYEQLLASQRDNKKDLRRVSPKTNADMMCYRTSKRRRDRRPSQKGRSLTRSNSPRRLRQDRPASPMSNLTPTRSMRVRAPLRNINIVTPNARSRRRITAARNRAAGIRHAMKSARSLPSACKKPRTRTSLRKRASRPRPSTICKSALPIARATGMVDGTDNRAIGKAEPIAP